LNDAGCSQSVINPGEIAACIHDGSAIKSMTIEEVPGNDVETVTCAYQSRSTDSCMTRYARDDESQFEQALWPYANSTLVVVRDNIGHVIGRAWVHKVFTEYDGVITMMDRKYPSDQSVAWRLLLNYADEKGWWQLSSDSISNSCAFLGSREISLSNAYIEIPFCGNDVQYAVYMDSFSELVNDRTKLYHWNSDQSGIIFECRSSELRGPDFDDSEYITCECCNCEFEECDTRSVYADVNNTWEHFYVCDGCVDNERAFRGHYIFYCKYHDRYEAADSGETVDGACCMNAIDYNGLSYCEYHEMYEGAESYYYPDLDTWSCKDAYAYGGYILNDDGEMVIPDEEELEDGEEIKDDAGHQGYPNTWSNGELTGDDMVHLGLATHSQEVA
jgi:hypothetical protein